MGVRSAACARAPERTRSCGRSFRRKSGAILCLLSCCLLVVVILAKALVIGWTDKQPPVSTVRSHVVHHRGPGSEALSRTDPAERLSCQLIWPKTLHPDGLGIPAVILGRHLAMLRPGRRCVLVAPSRPGQLWASRAFAWPQGSLCHGLSPPWAKQKRRNQRTPVGMITGSGVLRSGLWLY